MKQPTTKQQEVLLSLADSPAILIDDAGYRLKDGMGAVIPTGTLRSLERHGWVVLVDDPTALGFQIKITPEGLKAVQKHL